MKSHIKALLFAIFLLAILPCRAHGQALQYVAGGTITANTLVKLSTSATTCPSGSGNCFEVVEATTSDTAVPVYIATNGASSGGAVSVVRMGQFSCTMDATNSSFSSEPVYVTESTATGDDCSASSTAPAAGTFVVGFLDSSSTTISTSALVDVHPFVMPSTASKAESILGWGAQSLTLSSSSSACGVNTTPNCPTTILTNAHTLIRFTFILDNTPSGCSTSAVIGVRDVTSSTTLTSITVNQTGGAQFVDSGAISVATTAGDKIGVGIITAPSGCTTYPIIQNLAGVYQ